MNHILADNWLRVCTMSLYSRNNIKYRAKSCIENVTLIMNTNNSIFWISCQCCQKESHWAHPAKRRTDVQWLYIYTAYCITDTPSSHTVCWYSSARVVSTRVHHTTPGQVCSYSTYLVAIVCYFSTPLFTVKGALSFNLYREHYNAFIYSIHEE